MAHTIDVAESHEAVWHLVGKRSADGLVSVGRKFVPEMVVKLRPYCGPFAGEMPVTTGGSNVKIARDVPTCTARALAGAQHALGDRSSGIGSGIGHMGLGVSGIGHVGSGKRSRGRPAC